MTDLLERGADPTVVADLYDLTAEPTSTQTSQTFREMSFLRGIGCTCTTDPTLRTIGLEAGGVACYVVGSWEGAEGWGSWEKDKGLDLFNDNSEAYDNDVYYIDKTCNPPKKELLTPYPLSRRSATVLAIHLLFSKLSAEDSYPIAA
jgi:hypothetical protein